MLIPVRRAVDARRERKIVVVLRIDRAALGERLVERMIEQVPRVSPKAAQQEDKLGLSGVGHQFVLLRVRRARLKQSEYLGLLGHGQMNLHG